MSPNLFTVIIRHPDCVPAIVQGLDLAGITAVALGAHPVKSVEAFPAQWRDSTATARQIEDAASQGILAHYRPGGFDVEFIGAGPVPKWADEVIRSLDFTAREERSKARAERDALALRADQAKERARAATLPHPECREMFELEQRARLVSSAV